MKEPSSTGFQRMCFLLFFIFGWVVVVAQGLSLVALSRGCSVCSGPASLVAEQRLLRCLGFRSLIAWAQLPFGIMGSSWSREGIHVPCTGRQTPNSMAGSLQKILAYGVRLFPWGSKDCPILTALTWPHLDLTHTKHTETGRYTQVLVITAGPSPAVITVGSTALQRSL